MYTVVVLALPDAIAFDMATPIEAFGRVRLPDGRAGYRVLVAGPEPSVQAGPLRLAIDEGLAVLDRADLVVVPGRNDPLQPSPPPVLAAASRGGAGDANRVDLRRRLHAGGGGTARRA